MSDYLALMRKRLARAAALAALIPVAVAVFATDALACSYALGSAQVLAPAERAAFVQTTAGVPVQVQFPGGSSFTSAQFAVARMNTPTLPPLGAGLPAEVGTVVETGQLTFDAVSATWNGNANVSGWARTPGEYVWQTSGTQVIPATPPRVPNADGFIGISSCDTPVPLTLFHDGNWVHRFTILGASAVTARAGKARGGRVKVSGTIAAQFPGKVRLTVACPGKRARTTFVATKKRRWNRTAKAKRGCRINASVAARPGWVASTASVRVS